MRYQRLKASFPGVSEVFPIGPLPSSKPKAKKRFRSEGGIPGMVGVEPNKLSFPRTAFRPRWTSYNNPNNPSRDCKSFPKNCGIAPLETRPSLCMDRPGMVCEKLTFTNRRLKFQALRIGEFFGGISYLDRPGNRFWIDVAESGAGRTTFSPR